MRKLLLIPLLVSLNLIPIMSHAKGQTLSRPWVNCRSAVLIEVSTGKVLFAKNPNQIMAPASTTKIMTGILSIEKGDLTKKVRVSALAASKSGSSMNLRKNEQLTLKDLLYGLLLSSGNDAATAIAECIAGTESKFARMMTEKARQLGLEHTQFQNASGLPALNHYTTAYDLARIARYAIQNPVFAAIVKTKEAVVPGPTPGKTAKLVNHNKLLWDYPFSTGIKTGYTRKAGRCLVASAEKQDVSLIAVVLKSGSMYNDSRKLFEYGFKYLNVTDPTPVPVKAESKPDTLTSPVSNTADPSVSGAADLEPAPSPGSLSE